jgi:hypothetical protein
MTVKENKNKHMKKIILIFIGFMSVFFVEAQTLYTDDKGVMVFCKIEQTNQTCSCKGNFNSGDNFSTTKINIWKITLSIENGYSEAIVPRGIGIANISIYPDPIKPYSHEYCNYKHIKNYEPNSKQSHLDQSLYEWPIRGYKVEEIKSGVSITNTTYLYLYEGQKPKLTNSEFLGYRLKDDFSYNDPILLDIKDDYSSLEPEILIVKGDEMTKNSSKQEIIATENKEVVEITSKKVKPVDVIKTKAFDNSIIAPQKVEITSKLDRKENNTTIQENKLQATKKVISEDDTIKEIETKKVITECPGDKSLEYRKLSDASSIIEEQKAYSWLALYYSYVCECESGSQDSDQLVAVINNVVDSFMSNTKGKYGKIPKVTKCKAPVEK